MKKSYIYLLLKLFSAFSLSAMNDSYFKQPSLKKQFFQAVLSGKFNPCIEFLEKYEGCICWLDRKYNTPLHLAARMGNYDLCKLFVKYGASRKTLNSQAKTPYDLIPDIKTLFEDEPSYIISLQALKELLQVGTKDIKQLSKQGSLSSDEQTE